ncbi:putative phage abortive infection protein [Pseudoalteromonas maricaloris]|uniref:putative phage abortive infection protein n=1 Tax=Pseudoalteromonas maricaloris TaxID=184924 RepID=UPI003C139479
MKIRTLSWLLISGVIATVVLYAGLLIFLTWPISKLSISSSGVFGDSFGPLTSLFSGLAFAGLIITILMQRDELALQREELSLTRKELSGQKKEMQAQNETLKVQRFENTFFKMLEFLENCRNDIALSSNKRGRDAIKDLYESFSSAYLHTPVRDNIYSMKVGYSMKDECKHLSGISKQYFNFYREYGDELGQYYRTLYNLLKLVDRATFIDDKSVYTNLVRAQLSRYELLLLFYNSLSDYGSEKMNPLVKRFNILKHLESNLLPEAHRELLNEFKDK